MSGALKQKTFVVVEFINTNLVTVVSNNWIKAKVICMWPNWQPQSKTAEAVIVQGGSNLKD